MRFSWVVTCRDMSVVHGLTYIHENVLNSYLDDLTSNLDYVPKIFKRSRWMQQHQGKKGFQNVAVIYILDL